MTHEAPLLILDGRAALELDVLLEVTARCGGGLSFELLEDIGPGEAAGAVKAFGCGMTLAEQDPPELAEALGATVKRSVGDPELPTVFTSALAARGFERGGESTRAIRSALDAPGLVSTPEDAGLELACTSTAGASALVDAAYRYAEAEGLTGLSVVHNKSAAPSTDGLFLHSARNVAVRYPEVEFEDLAFEDFARRAVRDRRGFQLLVGPPSAARAALELLAAVANRPVPTSVLECEGGALLFGRHGSSGGQGALLTALVALFKHLGESSASERLERALYEAALGEDFARRPGEAVNGVLARS